MKTIKTVSVGERFGRLVVVSRSKEKGKPAVWLCQCDCGKDRTVRETSLTYTGIKSCGCLSVDKTRARATKHGLANTPEYRIWHTMKQRCANPNSPKYPIYGGRGIKVCERWQLFENFIADMGRRPSPNHSIDRIDNDGNYEPSNCRWATRKEQQNNQQHNTRLTFQDETLTIHQWADRLSLSAKLIESRLRDGWSVEDALTKPLTPAHLKRWGVGKVRAPTPKKYRKTSSA